MADVTTLGLAVDSSGVRRATDDLRGFTTAGGRAEASTRDVERAMTSATIKGQVFGQAIGEAIGKVADLVSGFIKLGLAAGDYQDIAEKTGGSAAGFATLRTSADVANTSVSQLGDASVRLSVGLSKIDDESKGAGRALDAIGLSVETLKGLSPDEQFRRVAQALSGFEDGAGKAAVAVALYGRAGADLLPFLKELGQETQTVTYLTAEQIARADEFGDAAKRNRSQISQLAQAMATETLPAISAFLGATKETVAELAGVTGQSKTLGAETGVRDFARGTAEALAFVVDAGDGVIRIFKSVGLTIGAVAASVAAVARGDFSQVKTIIADLREEGDALLQREQFSAKLARQFEDLKKTGATASAGGKGVLNFDNTAAPRIAKVRDEYTSLIRRIQEKTAAEQAEYDSETKLFPAQIEGAKIASDYASGLLKITPAQLANVDAALAAQLAIQRLTKAREDEKRWIDEATNANAGYVEQQMQYRDALDAKRRDAVLDLHEYGLTREELQGLEVARLRDAAASLEQKAAQADSAYLEENARLYREQAAALRETAQAREQLAARQARDRNDPTAGAERAVQAYLDDVKRAGDATARAVDGALRGLEDTTVAILSGHGGKDAAKQWVNEVIAEMQRLYVVKPLLASIFGGGSSGAIGSNYAGGWIGAIGSITGLFDGNYSANGGVGYSNAAGISGGRAGGGPVGAGNAYLIGENGPEILQMGGQAGNVVPNNAIGAKPVIINITNTGEAVSARQTGQRETNQAVIVDLLLEAVASDIQGGGRVASAAQSTWQLNRAGGAQRF